MTGKAHHEFCREVLIHSLVFVSSAAMMKAVGSVLSTTYSGKRWLKWFTKTAKAIIAELDGTGSATDRVGTCAVG